MKTPVLHYDYWLGQQPNWRRIIHRGLQGDESLLKLEFLLCKGFAPSKANFLAALYGFATEGQQVFLVGPKLQRMLGETDSTKVPLEFLKLPFDCFYVALAECPLTLYDGETGFHPATGMYVHMVDKDIPAITLCLWGQENEKSRAAGDDALQWVTLSLAEAVTQTDEDGTQYVDIDGYIRRIYSDPSRDDSDPGTNWPEDHTRNVDAAVELARLAFNLVLYVNSEQPDRTRMANKTAPGRKAMLKARLAKSKRNTKKRKRTQRIQRELDAISEARVVWLGKAIEEATEFPAPDAEPGPRNETGRKVRRHRRRGGWHTYWTGPRIAEDGSRQRGTKAILKWRPPQWVGSAIGDLITHRGTTYKFRAEKGDHDKQETRP